ncbi:hypothetical protein GQ53DRAFT_270571 [Thozetella sp. PMI_491]|nr:hypothetical protein GQ53DRAFT_270571 [Thozetella sp. PMI_491]
MSSALLQKIWEARTARIGTSNTKIPYLKSDQFLPCWVGRVGWAIDGLSFMVPALITDGLPGLATREYGVHVQCLRPRESHELTLKQKSRHRSDGASVLAVGSVTKIAGAGEQFVSAGQRESTLMNSVDSTPVSSLCSYPTFLSPLLYQIYRSSLVGGEGQQKQTHHCWMEASRIECFPAVAWR